MIALLVATGARASAIDEKAALVRRATALRSNKQFAAAIELLQQAAALDPDDLGTGLSLAETLGWDQRFREAERLYRQILQRHPDSRAASAGLARMLLWQGHYAEARSRFQNLARQQPSDLESTEGAATAAYWAGDWTIASREFAGILRSDPHRPFARQSLTEIASSTRGEQSLASNAVDDDQPFRSVRTEAAVMLHSDPLTQWRLAAGAYAFQNRRVDQSWTAPFLRVSNRRSFPWQRLRVDWSLGVLRYGDGATRALGGVALRRAVFEKSELVASVERRELVATVTAQEFHPAVTSWAVGWHRDGDPRRFLAAADAGRLRFQDHNRGWFAQGYALVPVVSRARFTAAVGGSVLAQDTSESRFSVESASSTRTGAGSFAYSFLGNYTPYWTPRNLREVRALLNLSSDLSPVSSLKFHADAGVARDTAESFGPAAGTSPFPPAVVVYQFDRRFHPWRVSATFSRGVAESTRLDFSVESSSTAFYRARTFRAALVRRR
ncbi:MAG: tetratricopeptide repeat protein [Thermoanaerobaculia bacterium]